MTDGRSVPAKGGLRRLFRRFLSSTDVLDAEELRLAGADAGATQVCDCPRGRQVTVSGRLTAVVYTPRTTLPTLEAELFDGSGSVTLVWLGRRRILGIEPGRRLSARGRLAVRDEHKVLYNPFYELEPSPS